MPAKTATPRAPALPLHTRSLTVALSRGEDERWHARGDVVDLRKNGFVPSGYDIQPSGVIHMMSIDLDLACGSLEIEEIAVDQPFVAVEASPATAGECCRDPAPRLLDMKGDRLDAGFTKRLGGHFGGALGCSHLLTLFQLMASTVPRGVRLETERAEREGTTHRAGSPLFRRSVFIDGVERNPETTEVTIQLADTHTRPIAEGDPVVSRLESSHEVKTFAAIDRKRFLIDALEARERRRSFDNLVGVDWTSHDALLSPIVGQRVIPGLAGRIFGLLGDAEEHALLRDNLLQFAPGFIQITAAQMDAYFEQRAMAAGPGTGEMPAVASLGGNTNSCYMWREGSAVSRAFAAGRAGPESD